MQITQGGTYTFFSPSDDGSLLYIDGNQVVNNDANHGYQDGTRASALQKSAIEIGAGSARNPVRPDRSRRLAARAMARAAAPASISWMRRRPPAAGR